MDGTRTVANGGPSGAVNKVMDLYHNATFCIKTEGGMTDEVKYGCGVCQGDPLSPILFAITLEPLLNMIRDKTKGIKVNDVDFKLAAYADDIALGVADKEDANIAVGCIKMYEEASEAKLRPDKLYTIGRSEEGNLKSSVFGIKKQMQGQNI